jgi:hypothetical protein
LEIAAEAIMKLVFIRILSTAGLLLATAAGTAHSQGIHGPTTDPAAPATHGPIADPAAPATHGPVSDPVAAPATHGPVSDPVTSETSGAYAWDATWIGGWEGGEGTQVIIAGGAVIGFFWGGDYLSIETSTNLADGGPIKFIYPGGEAVLKEGGEGELLITIHDEGKEKIGFVLKRG